MPSELEYRKRPDAGSNFSKMPEEKQHIMDLLDNECTTEDDDFDDDFDEEVEFAYQCDFQKKQPNKPCTTTSLLSSLLSSSSASSAEQCSSITVPKRISMQKSLSILVSPSSSSIAAAPTASTSDPLSESLKRNLEWEHCQHSLQRYQKNQTNSNQDVSWTDNFSKW
ncbi:hypothetical protein [Parasitella parasitica]|uniref:Uncharacterized protein n=1 Tax=Parasitella parasitica TaxID=35722 RepID=A0A0B7NNC7_9FUNG|nr:hypothetical protein [Parasitella parasitica]